MLKNYFTVAFRNLWKHKGFSSINLIGLALGLACSLLILLWVQDERGVDAFHQKKDRLFYVYERNFMGGKVQSWYWTQGPLAEELKKEIPEVESSTPLSWPETHTFMIPDKTLKEDGYGASADFFTMFSHPLLEGSAVSALNTPNSLAISRKMAVEFFGSPSAAIGKTISYENHKNFTVSAVYEDMSSRVSSPVNFIMSWTAYLEFNDWAKDWVSTDPRTVILLRSDADPALVEKKLTHVLDKFETERKEMHTELHLQRFSDYYLRSEFNNGVPVDGRISYVRLFSIVALFILLIACINFMNLTTARSVSRAKEIGVRKVMGALRGLLIRQFIGEAILMSLLSVSIALMLVYTLLPAFNQLTGKQIVLPLGNIGFWGSLLGITLFAGIFSGSYPAFFLSSFSPIRVLKSGTASKAGGGIWLRRGLVVFQFVLSIVLILSTMMISRQVQYMQNARLGYDRENLLYIPVEGDLGKKLDVFRTEAGSLPGITDLSMLSDNPTNMNNGTLSFSWPGKNPNETDRFIFEAIGPDYVRTMKLQMVEGRDFSPAFPTDSSGILINETAAKLMGYADNAIGKTMTMGRHQAHIVGVVKDFHFGSLHNAIMPLALQQGRGNDFMTIVVRTEAGKTAQALAGLEKLYKQLAPAYPFSYKFSDQEYARLYVSERMTGSLSVAFAALAIFISCLGLLGLSMFTAEQRTREIGIRKVLGASVSSLFKLLSVDFLALVGVAFLIAAPLGYWAMNSWLKGFAYRTAMPWWIFAGAGLLAATIALATVCMQALKAARVNPVKSLRAE